MWNENKIRILENSFSSSFHSENSRANSTKSLPRNNDLTAWKSQQLPIDSEKRLNEPIYCIKNHLQNNQNFTSSSPKVDGNPSNTIYLNRQNQLGLNENPYFSKINQLTSQLTRPSYQVNNSLSSFNPHVNCSLSSSSSQSKNIIQRRLNTSSRKSINHNQISQKKIELRQHFNNPYKQTTSFSNLNNVVQNQQLPSNFNSFSFQQKSSPQRINQKQLYLLEKQKQKQMCKNQQQNFQKNIKNEIKSFKTITNVPYFEKYIDYQPQVILVPKQKVIEKKYVVENIIDYVPVIEEQIDGYDLIPQQVIKYRLQYQLVEQQIVYLPKDKAWIGNSLEKRAHKKKKPHHVVNTTDNIYLSRNQNEKASDKKIPNQRINTFINNNCSIERQRSHDKNLTDYHQKLRYSSNQGSKLNHFQISQKAKIQNNNLPLNPKDNRQTYDNLINYFINYEPLRTQKENTAKRIQQTFHITSQKSQNSLN